MEAAIPLVCSLLMIKMFSQIIFNAFLVQLKSREEILSKGFQSQKAKNFNIRGNLVNGYLN